MIAYKLYNFLTPKGFNQTPSTPEWHRQRGLQKSNKSDPNLPLTLKVSAVVMKPVV